MSLKRTSGRKSWILPLLDFKLDRSESYGGGGSTDVGDVSWVVPTVQTNVCCYAAGTALHSWQAVAQGKASIAHKGMLTATKVMACTGADLLEIRSSSKRLIRTGWKSWTVKHIRIRFRQI